MGAQAVFTGGSSRELAGVCALGVSRPIHPLTSWQQAYVAGDPTHNLHDLNL